jgi:hypothetical protein
MCSAVLDYDALHNIADLEDSTPAEGCRGRPLLGATPRQGIRCEGPARLNVRAESTPRHFFRGPFSPHWPREIVPWLEVAMSSPSGIGLPATTMSWSCR